MLYIILQCKKDENYSVEYEFMVTNALNKVSIQLSTFYIKLGQAGSGIEWHFSTWHPNSVEFLKVHQFTVCLLRYITILCCYDGFVWIINEKGAIAISIIIKVTV